MDNPRYSDEISNSICPKSHQHVYYLAMVPNISFQLELDCSNSQRTLYITLPLIVIATCIGAVIGIEVLYMINIMGLATEFIT